MEQKTSISRSYERIIHTKKTLFAFIDDEPLKDWKIRPGLITGWKYEEVSTDS